MDLPTEPAARNIITPKRHLSNLQVYIYIYIYIYIYFYVFLLLLIYDLLLKIYILESRWHFRR